MQQLKGDARDFLNSKRVAKTDIEKLVGDQNVVQQLARNHSSLATVDGVSKLHGICTNEFGTDTLEAVKEGVDHHVIPEASILPNENPAQTIENDLELGNRGDMSTSLGDQVFGMNTSEDVEGSLAIMLDKDLNKGRETSSKENWNMVIRRKASSNVSLANIWSRLGNFKVNLGSTFCPKGMTKIW
ncbi:hypothetical protein R3W88_011591 [Solanum pinnatisectum]|uniref:Uncharacterized protein n=1 Tax=Solanum pinnatisectum TaxID=50273 RepID=A0AAV9L7B8_9SOLN|nr:hypothetical protein R3W88_011591 [Solanum pinnatisectum]